MSVEHRYSPPQTSTGTAIPGEVVSYLNGSDLLAKTQAVRLSTVNASGWPMRRC